MRSMGDLTAGMDRYINEHRKLVVAVISSIGWLPVAVFSLFIKKVNIELRYFDIFYKYSNIGSTPSLADLMSFYQNDIVFNFFLIPLLIIALVYRFPRKITRYFILAVSLLLLVLLFANLHSWGTLAMPINYTTLIDAAAFGLQSPKFISMYIDMDSWMKLSILMAGSVAGYLLPERLAGLRILNACCLAAVGAMLLASLTMAALGSTSEMKKSRVFRNFISLSVTAFFNYDPTAGNSNRKNNGEIIDSFIGLTNTKFSDRSPYRAKARGNDLIVIVLETGPTKFIDLKNDLDSFPALKKLSGNSLISHNHFTTYPGSSQALFSLFLSTYPPKNYYKSCIASKEKFSRNFPGFISRFREAGYATGLYLPIADTIPIDKILHNNLGFTKVYFADGEQGVKGRQSDLAALDEMKRDITKHIDNGSRYVSVFLPQVGHAPWKDRPGSTPVKTYGKQMAVLQDGWLGELLTLLEKKGRLGSTTIVVTSDHGIRTSREDPSFNMGFIDEYTYQVPMVIYSKSSFPEQVIIERKTSHLDVSPTLIDLFGLSKEGLLQEGQPMWDDSISERDLYFLGNWHCNIDGYCSNNRYFMFHDVLDLYFANAGFHFDFHDVVKDKSQIDTIRNRINTLYEIQDALYENYLCN